MTSRKSLKSSAIRTRAFFVSVTVTLVPKNPGGSLGSASAKDQGRSFLTDRRERLNRVAIANPIGQPSCQHYLDHPGEESVLNNKADIFLRNPQGERAALSTFR